jgi:hypothetical protein
MDDGGVAGRLDPVTREILAQAATGLAAVLGGPAQPGLTGGPYAALFGSGVGTAPLRRVLPRASFSDQALAAEFAHLTREDLSGLKAKRLLELAGRLRDAVEDRFELDRASAEAMAAGLNDLRLALSESIGIETPEQAEAVQTLALLAVRDETGGTGTAGADAVRAALELGLDPRDERIPLYNVASALLEDLIEALTAPR